MLDYAELSQHAGHTLLCHEYQIGNKDLVALECFTCEEILTELESEKPMNRQELIDHIEELDISEFAKDVLIHALAEMEQVV